MFLSSLISFSRKTFLFFIFPINGVSFLFEYTISLWDANNFTCFFSQLLLKKTTGFFSPPHAPRRKRRHLILNSYHDPTNIFRVLYWELSWQFLIFYRMENWHLSKVYTSGILQSQLQNHFILTLKLPIFPLLHKIQKFLPMLADPIRAELETVRARTVQWDGVGIHTALCHFLP